MRAANRRIDDLIRRYSDPGSPTSLQEAAKIPARIRKLAGEVDGIAHEYRELGSRAWELHGKLESAFRREGVDASRELDDLGEAIQRIDPDVDQGGPEFSSKALLDEVGEVLGLFTPEPQPDSGPGSRYPKILLSHFKSVFEALEGGGIPVSVGKGTSAYRSFATGATGSRRTPAP